MRVRHAASPAPEASWGNGPVGDSQDLAREFASALTSVLRECLERSGAVFLDPGSALLETLVPLSAGLASCPVHPGGPTVAGQVRHFADAIDAAIAFLADEPASGPNDPVVPANHVDEAGWDELRDDLGRSYDLLMMVVADPDTWSDPSAIHAGFRFVAHTAAHLGELRRSLAILCPAAG
jgi:hypothetical protein